MVKFHEPHPTISKSSRMPTGRGGAGNITTVAAIKANELPPDSLISSRDNKLVLTLSRGSASSTATQTPRTNYIGGRGGAGNARPFTQRAQVDLTETLGRLTSGDGMSDGYYHFGRGGSGNLTRIDSKGQTKERQMSHSSSASENSESGRVRRSFDWFRSRSFASSNSTR